MIRTLLGNLHLVAGFVALAAFWFPLALKKGSRLHRTFGWVFVGAMSFILVSAATMTVERIVAGNRDFALVLGFLTLITSFARSAQNSVENPEAYSKIRRFDKSQIFSASVAGNVSHDR